jgi:hypothetical protein
LHCQHFLVGQLWRNLKRGFGSFADIPVIENLHLSSGFARRQDQRIARGASRLKYQVAASESAASKA